MSWKDELQPASFRGVPFHAIERRGGAGRRFELHEYPMKDLGWAEDTGGHHPKETLEAFVIGLDHFAQRDRLIEALNKPGPGTLVHPSRGIMQVQMGECSWTESTREGGLTSFILNFVLAGDRKFPVAQADTVSAVESSVNTGLTALQNDVVTRFAVSGLPGWVGDSAAEWVNKGLEILEPFATVASTASNLLRTINGVRSNLSALMAKPESLAAEITGVLQSLFGEADDIDWPQTLQRNVADTLATAKTAEPISTLTPSRQQQSDNRDAVIDLFDVSAALLAVDAIAKASAAVGVTNNSESPFDSYDHAIAVRDEQLTLLDGFAETASDDLYLAIRDLQGDLIRHIDAHGYQLQQVGTYTPQVEMPALVIAHMLYGDASLDGDIVRRNGVRHPGFVPAGDPLEVLNG